MKAREDMINILFCGNDKVFDGMLTCSLSIFKRTETKEPFHFYLFTMDVSDLRSDYKAISEEQVRFFENVIKEYNPENTVRLVDVKPYYEQEFRGCPNEQCYCSPYTLLRLFADQIPDIPEKLLYLDADIMFNRDISLLYNYDISGVEYAGAPDHYGKYTISPRYINAGVLLFNMKMCRETQLFKKARDLIKTKKLIFADQSAIARSTTKKMVLPQKFNDQKFLHKSTVVRHFSKRLFWTPYPHTANIKQWQVSQIHKIFGYFQFDDILYEYIYLITKFNKEHSGENNG